MIRNARKLQGAKETFKKIGIAHELTKKEREKNAELMKEAKELNENANERHYVLWGPCWDRKIVNVKKKNT